MVPVLTSKTVIFLLAILFHEIVERTFYCVKIEIITRSHMDYQ